MKSCGIITVYKNKFLILEHNPDYFDFPKGYQEPNENDKETALRETFEETGLAVDIIPGFIEQDNFVIERNGKKIQKMVVWFLGTTKNKNIILSNEHVSCSWLNYEDAIKLLTHNSSKKLLTKAKNFLEGKSLKNY